MTIISQVKCQEIRIYDWVFQTRNDWGASRPCLLPPMAAKSKPPAVRVVVDSEFRKIALMNKIIAYKEV